MKEIRHLQSIISNEKFLDMNRSTQKEYVLSSIELDLLKRTNKSYNDLDAFNLINETDKAYLKSMMKSLLEIMSVMQGKDIIIKKGNSKVRNQSRISSYDLTRLSNKPLFTYDIEGRILSIEYSYKTELSELLYEIINNFDNKFLKQVSIKTKSYKLSHN